GFQIAKELSRGNHQVVVLTKYRDSNLPNQGYQLIQVKESRKLWFLSYFSAVEYESFDLVILNDYKSIFFAGLFFNSICFQKSLCILHGSEPENIYMYPSILKRITFFKYFFTKALFKSKGVVAVSNFMKEKFLLKTNLMDLEKKIEVMYAGLDNSIFYPDKNKDFKSMLNIPDSAIVMLSVSRLVSG